MSETERTNSIIIITLVLSLASLGFCLCGLLIAFSYPLGSVNIESVDTSIFIPELSFLTGLCLWIPGVALALAAVGTWFRFGRSPLQRQLAQAHAELEQAREFVLQTYLDVISEFILKDFDPNADNSNAILLARQRTIEALSLLDSERKRQLLQFLYKSQLITGQSIIKLEQADLRGAALSGMVLSGANLSGSNLRGANLHGTDLSEADLSKAIVSAEQLATASSVVGATLPDQIDFTTISDRQP